MKVIYKPKDEEINSVSLDLKNRDFKRALEKTKILAKRYSRDYTVLKLFSTIYFNMMEWEKSIIYYKKILEYEEKKFITYTNIGVAFFKLGKINKSIDAFKKSIKENENFYLAHNNLGISYVELGELEKATYHFVYASKLNKNDLSAIRNLINILTILKPKNKDGHPLIKIDSEISRAENNLKNLKLYEEQSIYEILNFSNELINIKENLFFNETQIFRKNSTNLNCKRHFKVFDRFNIIPKYCFDCYKIQINFDKIINLIKLYLIFDNILLENNNIRKCVVEIRNEVKGNYKGYIYCKGIEEANKIEKVIKKEISIANIDNFTLNIKHGCSEFYKSYPEFQKISLQEKDGFEYNESWMEKENIIDSEEPPRIEADKKVWQETLGGVSLSDILIINNWINYADIIGDYSYKKICKNKIQNPFINKIIKSQLEFRKKQIEI